MTKLLKDGKAVSDAWVHVADGDAVPETGPVIVTLARWQAEHNTLAGRKDGLGIRLESGQSPDLIKDDLDRFAVVALAFPKFGDGRAYSHARLLKDRLGFKGEVRAVGDVLRDQYRAMHRCGFDVLEISGARRTAPCLSAGPARAGTGPASAPPRGGGVTVTRLGKSAQPAA